MSNFRSEFGFDKPYWTINREERNYAALLYHVLLCHDNLQRFLDLVGYLDEVEENQVAAYVEYAFLRDLWNQKKLSNAQKRQAITNMLSTSDVKRLADADTLEWNAHFGATPHPSKTHIQNPGRWSLIKYDEHIPDNDDFVKTSRFKWSFNIKPDLVIQTATDRAVVIEAKYESGESCYPSSPVEQQIWDRRHITTGGVWQTELQQYMFEQLLGINAQHVYLVKSGHPHWAGDPTPTTLTWGRAFQNLELTGLPRFAREWLDTLAD